MAMSWNLVLFCIPEIEIAIHGKEVLSQSHDNVALKRQPWIIIVEIADELHDPAELAAEPIECARIDIDLCQDVRDMCLKTRYSVQARDELPAAAFQGHFRKLAHLAFSARTSGRHPDSLSYFIRFERTRNREICVALVLLFSHSSPP